MSTTEKLTAKEVIKGFVNSIFGHIWILTGIANLVTWIFFGWSVAFGLATVIVSGTVTGLMALYYYVQSKENGED